MGRWTKKALPNEELMRLGLTPEEGFVLSRLDVALSPPEVVALTGLPLPRVEEILDELRVRSKKSVDRFSELVRAEVRREFDSFPTARREEIGEFFERLVALVGEYFGPKRARRSGPGATRPAKAAPAKKAAKKGTKAAPARKSALKTAPGKKAAAKKTAPKKAAAKRA